MVSFKVKTNFKCSFCQIAFKEPFCMAKYVGRKKNRQRNSLSGRWNDHKAGSSPTLVLQGRWGKWEHRRIKGGGGSSAPSSPYRSPVWIRLRVRAIPWGSTWEDWDNIGLSGSRKRTWNHITSTSFLNYYRRNEASKMVRIVGSAFCT